MDWQQFASAVREGAQSAAPASANAAVTSFFTPTFRLGATDRSSKALGNTAEIQADEEEKARTAAREAEIRKLQDSMDPSKYQKLRKDDGGFAFYDPAGKQIDVDTFAKRTGQRRVDVLKDSENPLDQQFIDDWSKMNELNQAVWSNDTAILDDYKADYPDLFAGNANPTPEQINKKLLEKYPHIYGMGNYNKSYSNLGKPVFQTPARPVVGGATSGGGWRPN